MANARPLPIAEEKEKPDNAKKNAQEVYTERLALYLEETKALTALEKHVFLFLDKNKTFSWTTVSAELTRMHGTDASMKGLFITLFNGTHSGSCVFAKDAKNGFAKNLHLGTTRIWNAEGNVDEDMWKRLVAFTTKGQEEQAEKKISLSSLMAFLGWCIKKDDDDEQNTGRYAKTLFSSQTAQTFAAKSAWKQVFESLACGWVQKAGAKDNELEPYLSLNVAREFFVDSPVAFLKAECGLLPVAKPAVAEQAASAAAAMKASA